MPAPFESPTPVRRPALDHAHESLSKLHGVEPHPSQPQHRPDAPFDGYGREQGAEALENYTRYKTVWANLG